MVFVGMMVFMGSPPLPGSTHIDSYKHLMGTGQQSHLGSILIATDADDDAVYDKGAKVRSGTPVSGVVTLLRGVTIRHTRQLPRHG